MRARPVIVTAIVIVGLLAALAIAVSLRLPPHTLLPTHWNAAGEPDRFADASYALALPVVLAVAVSIMFAAAPRIEPLQHRLEGSAALLATCWTGLLALMVVMEVTVAAHRCSVCRFCPCSCWAAWASC